MFTFIILSLTFTIPSLVFNFSSVLATSSNNDDGGSDSHEASNDENDTVTSSFDENQQQPESDIDEESNGENNNGSDQTPGDSQNAITDSTQEIPLQNNNQIQPNTLSGSVGIQEKPRDILNAPIEGVEIQKRLPDDAILAPSGYLTVILNQTESTAAMNTVSYCVDTKTESGETIMATPHCSGMPKTVVKHAVQPGDVVLSMTVSPRLNYDETECLINIGVNEQKSCGIHFSHNSNFPGIQEQPRDDIDLSNQR